MQAIANFCDELLSNTELCESVARFPVLLWTVLSRIATCGYLGKNFFPGNQSFFTVVVFFHAATESIHFVSHKQVRTFSQIYVTAKSSVAL